MASQFLAPGAQGMPVPSGLTLLYVLHCFLLPLVVLGAMQNYAGAYAYAYATSLKSNPAGLL